MRDNSALNNVKSKSVYLLSLVKRNQMLKIIKYINLALFTVMIVMNYLANALPLNNVTTGELSDSYPNLFVPAGITFSIWGIIYLLLFVFCIIQFTSPNQMVISGITWLFAITCILNSLWIVAWHFRQLPLSLLLMVLLLVVLAVINIRIKVLPAGLIKATFGIYLGWICIATIANVTALLVSYGWHGFGISEINWTLIMIIAGALVAALSVYFLNNPFIGFSVIWAFAGIAMKRQEDHRSIFVTAIIALIAIAVITGWGFIRKYSAQG